MNDDIRLQAVERYNMLDLDNEPELLEIVELASAICGTAYALITFLDKDTQYLKVRKGTEQTIVPREMSFCTHALQQNELMVVADALTDLRFVNNPMVVNDPGIRFYAGMPLTTSDGHKVGTLCILDTQQHILNNYQETVLKILSSQVMKIMELRVGLELLEKKQNEVDEQSALLNDANTRLRSFFESSTNFHVLLGKNGDVIDFNKTAYNFIEKVHHTALSRGDIFVNYVVPSFRDTFSERYSQALKGQKSQEEGYTDYDTLGIIWWEAVFEPAFDPRNQIVGISYIIRNVSERKLKEQKIVDQNQSLLNIAHIQAHEFRGPLSTIMGLMNLMNTDPEITLAEYMPMLEHTVSKLDSTIRKIVKSIEHNATVTPVMESPL